MLVCRAFSAAHVSSVFSCFSVEHFQLLVCQAFSAACVSGVFSYSCSSCAKHFQLLLCQTIGLAATNNVCSFGVPCALYIDDRHVGQLRLPLHPLPSSFPAFQLAEMAAYIVCFTSISLGYFIVLSKSFLLPATALTFLGYVCDWVRQAFLLPPDKRAKFSALRESILEHKSFAQESSEVCWKNHIFCLVGSCCQVVHQFCLPSHLPRLFIDLRAALH